MDEVLLHVAEAMSARSTCPRGNAGAVVALDGRILSSGYNGAPAGLLHCAHAADCAGCADPEPEHQIMDAMNDRPQRPRGHRPDCLTITGCLHAVHAEANAIAFAARHGVLLLGATMYTTMSPCRGCAQLIIQAGIVAVHSREHYRDPTGEYLLTTANITVTIGN